MTIQSGQAHITPELDFSNITFADLNTTFNRRQTPWQISSGNLPPIRNLINTDAELQEVLNRLSVAKTMNDQIENDTSNMKMSWFEIFLISLLGLILLIVIILVFCYWKRCHGLMNVLSPRTCRQPGCPYQPMCRQIGGGMLNEAEADVFEPLNPSKEGITLGPRSVKYRPREPLPSQCSASMHGSSLNVSMCETDVATGGFTTTCGTQTDTPRSGSVSSKRSKRPKAAGNRFGQPTSSPKSAKVNYARVTTPLDDTVLASLTGAPLVRRGDGPIRVNPYYTVMAGDIDYLEPSGAGATASS